MSLVIIGLNHLTAPLDLLEQVTVAAEDTHKALHDLTTRPHISEAVVLSTCNRTEVYVEAERFHGAFQDVRDFFAAWSFAPPDQVGDALYTFHDEQAVAHLFRVAGGLDSAVVGEHEILGQVKRAWQLAQDQGTAGLHLNTVFRAALESGKRVRTDTGIARHIASVSQAAIVLAEAELAAGDGSGLAGRSVLLVGAGEMGTGMARTLADLRPASLTVMSRTPETAEALAHQIGAKTRPFTELASAIADADVVFSSTAAPSMVISRETVASAVREPLLIVDVAMPRDVEPAVADLDGVALIDLDRIGAFVAAGLDSRQAELSDAEAIVDADLARFAALIGERSVTPLIVDFRRRAESLRTDELARQQAKLGDLDEAQVAVVDEVTRAVLAKLLHEPTIRLKEAADSLRGERLAAALRELFDLPEPS